MEQLKIKANTLPELLDLSARQYADQIFVLAHDHAFGTHAVTFGQFRRLVARTALRLRLLGISETSRCAFLCDTSLSTLCHVMAVISLGAVACIMNHRYPISTLSNMMKRCSASFLFAEHCVDKALQLANENNLQMVQLSKINIDEDGIDREGEEEIEVSSLAKLNSSDTAIAMFTTGTTSIPKGVIHTHSTILYACESKRSTLAPILEPGGTTLGILPLFHVMGFTNIFLFCLYNGLRYAIFEGPVTPDLYVRASKLVNPFTFDTVPWILEELIETCKRDPVFLSVLQNTKYLSFGGSKISPGVVSYYTENGVTLLANWGQTELGGAVFHGNIDPKAKDQWQFMQPLHGVSAYIEKSETNTNTGELILKNSLTLATGYLVEGGELQLFSRDLYRTNDLFEETDDFYSHVIRKDSIIVHVNGEKTNPLPFIEMKQICPTLISRVCTIGNNRPHNMLFIQLADKVRLSLQAEESVWEHVTAANATLPPHSHVYRHHIVLLTSDTPLPISNKGDVIIRQVETMFGDQIEKIYKNSAKLSNRYPIGFLERLHQVDSHKQKGLMVGLIKDVLSSVLGLLDSQQIDIESTFEEHGVRSFEAIQVRNVLSGVLEGLGHLPATMLYEHPKVSMLADWLLQLAGFGSSIPNMVSSESTVPQMEKMAIIGAGCRFPGGIYDMPSFWDMISKGVDAVTLIPPDRWDWEQYWDPAGGPGKMTSNEGAFLSQVDLFDADLFGILPKEAHEMDPQHRILLETTWEAIEHSGYSPDSLRGTNTGVYLGIFHHDYVTCVQKEHGGIMTIGTYYGSGNSFSAAAGRISYLMDLHGPNISIDTACSSSLVALQLACHSLQTRESDMCIVGGITLMLSPHNSVYLSKAGMTGPSGRCKAFDANANGFGRGEGCGVVMVKRLDDAIADGDNVLAVVCSVAVNHDGKSNGFTAPSRAAQEQVIDAALKKAGIEPSQIGFLEAHGTGTTIGDNIEIHAAGSVLGRNRPKDKPLLVGSVKTNIAHTEAAAGVASVIKAVLCLQKAEVPKLNLFQKLNPNIDNIDQIPAIIPTSNTPWVTGGPDIPRIAGVNSFGFSGTNAHAILMEAPKIDLKVSDAANNYIITLSACPKTPNALTDMVKQFQTYLATTSDDLDDICYTSHLVRSPLKLRTVFIGRDKNDFLDAMQQFNNIPEERSIAKLTSMTPKVVCIMPVEITTQLVENARTLYISLPIFRDKIQEIERGVGELLSKDTPQENQALVNFALEYAITKLWFCWGVKSESIVTSGPGILAVLCALGVLDIHDAIQYVQSTPTQVSSTQKQEIERKMASLKTEVFVLDCPLFLQGVEAINQISTRKDISKFVEPSSIVFDAWGMDNSLFQDIKDPIVTQCPQKYSAKGHLSMLALLAQLYMAGVEISWSSFHSNEIRKKVVLPLYPFQRQRYWYPTYHKPESTDINSNLQQLPYVMLRSVHSASNVHIFETKLALDGDTQFLSEHKIFGHIIFPMTAYVEMAIETAFTLLGTESVSISDFVVCEPLALELKSARALQLVATPTKNEMKEYSFEIHSRAIEEAGEQDKWRMHATGKIVPLEGGSNKQLPKLPVGTEVKGIPFYKDLVHQGFEYGPHFQCMTTGNVDQQSSIIKLAFEGSSHKKVIFHPALFDACLHSMLLFFNTNAASQTHIYLPLTFDVFSIYGKIGSELWSQFVPSKSFTPFTETLTGNVTIYDNTGSCVAEFTGINLKRTSRKELQANLRNIKNVLSNTLFNLNWNPMPLEEKESEPVTVLIVTENDEFGLKVGNHIKRAGKAPSKVMTVSPNFSTTKLSDILSDSFWEDALPSHIMFISAANESASSSGCFISQFTSLQNALLLTQGVVSYGFKKPPRLWLVTKNATWADEEEKNLANLALLSSPIWGFGAAICLEHPELACKRVDLDSHEESAELLYQELINGNLDDQVGFRNGSRYSARFTPLVPLDESSYQCDPSAVYLVTGGFGGIGIKSIDMLVALGAKHIIVLSRSGLPQSGKPLASVEGWRAAGVDIDAFAVDMANFEQLKQILAQLKYPLKGVLHSAGIANDAAILNSDWSKFESVFGPKVCGSWNLHLLTQDMKLDFFVLYSSIAASLGNAGQSNYAAANYFMDALAHYRRGMGLAGLSVNWGAWADVGVAAERNLTAKLQKKGIISFSPEVGIEALRSLLVQAPSGSVTVLRANWDTYFKQYSSIPPFFSKIAKTIKKTSSTESFLYKLAEAEDMGATLLNYIRAEIAGAVGISADSLDADCPLTNLGVDSLVATQLRNNITNALTISLPATIVFDHPTVNALFTFLKPIVVQKIQNEAQSTEKTVKVTTSAVKSVQPHPKIFDLSYAQKGLWWIWKTAPESCAYNVTFYPKITASDFDSKLLGKCWDEVSSRHHMMHTTFIEDEDTGLPKHLVHDELKNPFLVKTVVTEEELHKELVQNYSVPFDLISGPLYRLAQFSIGDEHIIMIVAHHIVTDFMTIVLIMEELIQLYSARKQRRTLTLPAVPYFSEYVQHNQKKLKEEGDQMWQYWKKQLAGGIPHLNFNFSKQRSADPTTIAGASFYFNLGPELKSLLEVTAKKVGVTVFHILMAGFQILLMKYTNQTDIFVGNFTSDRPKSEHKSLVGYCVNTIVIRGDFSADPTVTEALTQVSKTVLSSFKHDYPFPLMMEKLNQEYGPSNLQVAMNYLQYNPLESGSFGMPLEKSNVLIPQQEGQFDLELEVNGATNPLSIFRYSTQAFKPEHIEMLSVHYISLLNNLCNNLSTPLSKIGFITPTEHEQVIHGWNNTVANYEWNKRAYDLIEEQVKLHPSNTAMIYENESITYSEMHARVTGLADYLKSLGVGPNTICGVYSERSLSLLVAIFAIFKCGGTYLPMEPDYPIPRLEFMLTDSKAEILLTNKPLYSEFLKASTKKQDIKVQHVVYLDKPIPQHEPVTDVCTNNNPDDMAYIMYTSGSTGTPKGVMIPHRAVTNLLFWMLNSYKLGSTDRVLMKTSICFDVSVFELFWAFICGGALVIAKQGGQLNPDYMIELIKREGVSALHFVPSHLQILVDHPDFDNATAKVHTIILIGEPVPLTLRQRLGSKVHNLYGPTETTVLSTFFPGPSFSEVFNNVRTMPIGKPIANTTVYILDSNMLPVPCGVAGELYIGGAGVALGYLNRPELNGEKFLQDPFNASAKMFKTGDSGMFLTTGDIELFGRLDNQVKLRGFRLELGEIDAALLRHFSVKEALTMIVDSNQNKLLVAYITVKVPSYSQEDLIIELRSFLSTFLPSYMVPMHFVFIKEFPLLPNGKVNRKGLPSPTPNQSNSSDEVKASPLSAGTVEQKLQVIWTQLGLHISKNDQNFYEAGGSSLLAIQFLFKFQKEFQQQLPVAEFFKDPTISGITKYITRNSPTARIPTVKGTLQSSVATPDIAIVGMGCRYPGADSLSQLWDILMKEKDTIQQAALIDSNGSPYLCHGGFIPDIDKFDPQLFNISPEEAAIMDPQQRLLLEVTYEALENAAIPHKSLENTRTGVFIGVPTSGYFELLKAHGIEDSELSRVGTGNFTSVVAGRIAYTYGFRGPSMSLDTGCSSSLVAVHLACKSLITGESDACIAGGVNTLLNKEPFIYLDKANMLASVNGRCKTFDADAEGYVRSEGCGIVVLKRLEDALANKDPIMAVIKGSAINQNGHSQNITVPSGVSQVSVIKDALNVANISPNEISYVEAHGSGTALGDTIEIESLMQALCPKTRAAPLVVGSVKTNIGHAETAAGVAGLIKVVLSLQNKIIPRHIHLNKLNPHFPSLQDKMVIPKDGPHDWEGSRIAGVSSFGISGTNAHVILASAPAAEQAKTPSQQRTRDLIIPLSARTDSALRNNALRLKECLSRATTEDDLRSIAYTNMVGRNHLESRLALIGGNKEEIVAGLDEYLNNNELTKAQKSHSGSSSKVIFLFSAEEHEHQKLVKFLSQDETAAFEFKKFAKTLVGDDPTFRNAFQEVVKQYHDLEANTNKYDGEFALFAFQYAFAKTWQNWGIEPSACVGVGSVGEYAAACIAGVITLRDTTSLLMARRDTVAKEPKFQSFSEMLVYARASTVNQIIGTAPAKIVGLVGLETTIIAGDKQTLQLVESLLRRSGIRHQWLPYVRVQSLIPFLSDANVEEFQQSMANIRLNEPLVPLFPQYNVKELSRSAPDLPMILSQINASGHYNGAAILEINSTSSATAHLQRLNRGINNAAHFLASHRNIGNYLIHILAKLYSLGISINWINFTSSMQEYKAAKKIVLPNYAFDRVRCWFNKRPFRTFDPSSVMSPKIATHANKDFSSNVANLLQLVAQLTEDYDDEHSSAIAPLLGLEEDSCKAQELKEVLLKLQKLLPAKNNKKKIFY